MVNIDRFRRGRKVVIALLLFGKNPDSKNLNAEQHTTGPTINRQAGGGLLTGLPALWLKGHSPEISSWLLSSSLFLRHLAFSFAVLSLSLVSNLSASTAFRLNSLDHHIPPKCPRYNANNRRFYDRSAPAWGIHRRLWPSAATRCSSCLLGDGCRHNLEPGNDCAEIIYKACFRWQAANWRWYVRSL